jgi:hypothetical protein
MQKAVTMTLTRPQRSAINTFSTKLRLRKGIKRSVGEKGNRVAGIKEEKSEKVGMAYHKNLCLLGML